MEYNALVAACANRILLDRDGVRLLENLYVEILLNVRCAHLFLPVRLSSLPNISPLHPAFVSLDDRGVLHDRQRRSRPVRRFGTRSTFTGRAMSRDPRPITSLTNRMLSGILAPRAEVHDRLLIEGR